MWPRSGPFNLSPKKDRERDKAQHMPLCVPHVVQARVDELTEMSDLDPQDKERTFKVRRADNMKHKIERCDEENMTYRRMR